ncbi:hypothetical protein [Nonomuraea wenchangensis]|uniref:Uncharacterized protein n=1 Tax=Nonomuraea wenchangensis TaxID=568860 RepID=A0A1I0L8I7_9ACTN|nr:hypothetical protein [Nonomuraea wenchangensis]SEU36309.1 hypothetical protein SAMN05421811_113185 [Nonomuraea wenchangensis]
MTERELQTLRHQLAAAQAATGLIVPPLADVDGQPGVRLPGCAFHAVTLHDGIVMLHHNDSAIALADAQQSPTQARTLSAALQAVTAAAPG